MQQTALWFGDERGYNATKRSRTRRQLRLWFGDERGYNATKERIDIFANELWFGDERGYNATLIQSPMKVKCCGLVMKEDITQQAPMHSALCPVVVW